MLAEALDRMGRFEDAEEKYLSVLKELNDVQGDRDGYTNLARMDLANFYRRRQLYDEAEKLFEETLNIQRKLKKNEGEHWCMHCYAEYYRLVGKYKKSIKMHMDALEQTKGKDGKNSVNYIRFMGNVTRALEDDGNYDEAERHHQMAIQIAKGSNSNRPRLVAEALNNFGCYLNRRERYAEAEENLIESL